MPSCFGNCGLGPSECQGCSEAAERARTSTKTRAPTVSGRDWNERLRRRLQDSICIAQDNPRPTRLLVTDLADSDLTLVEVLGDINGSEQVVTEFLVRPKSRPKVLRYRSERGWPE